MTNDEQNELVQKEAKRIWKGRSVKIVLLFVLIFCVILIAHTVNSYFHKLRCRTNIYGLRLNFVVYANDFEDKLPTFDSWNDLIMEYADTPESAFHCRGSKSTGMVSDYSLNANLMVDAGVESGDNVFLFESVPGWNQAGGLDLFNFNNHRNGGWYNTLSYPEGYFIRPKEIESTKWK